MNQKFLLRTLQVLSGIMALVIVFMAARIFNKVDVGENGQANVIGTTETVQETVVETAPRQKVARPSTKRIEVNSLMPRKDGATPLEIAQDFLNNGQALEARLELSKITPGSQESTYLLGLIAAALNEPDNAKSLLAKSLEFGTDEKIKGFAKKVLDDYSYFELAQGAEIEFLEAKLAQTFNQADQHGLAIELANNVLKTKPGYRDIWIILGHSYLFKNQLDSANNALSRAIQLDASHPAAYFYRGITNLKLNNFADAILDFERTIRYGWQPQNLAKKYLAETYFAQNDYAKAFPIYKEAVLSDPSDINDFIRPMALAINHLNLPIEAFELARKAYEAHPDTAMSNNLLGWAAMANNDFDAAGDYLEKALAIDPSFDAAYLNLGQLRSREGNYNEALKYYQKAADLASKNNNQSIGSTAGNLYKQLSEKIENGLLGSAVEQEKSAIEGIPQSEPLTQTVIPSLSLQ